MRTRNFISLFIALFFLLPLPTLANDAPASPTTADQLLTIQRDITWLEQQIAQRQKDETNADKDEIAGIENDVSDLQSRLEKARATFIATVAGVELPGPENATAAPQKRDLIQELQELVVPVFDAIRRVSEKPRRIEAIRDKIFDLNNRLDQINLAITKIDDVLRARTYPAFRNELVSSRDSLSHERDEIQVRVDALQRNLNLLAGDHRTVMQVLSDGAKDFAATRGKNLLIAFIVFITVLWLLLRTRNALFSRRVVHAKLQHLSRTAHVLSGIAAGLVAFIAVILTLHFLNDWFLATLLILSLAASVWAFKALIPAFVHEAKFVLNLGPVRQGERVVWQGIPWHVKMLGFRTVLENESLQGGTVTLPASSLSTLLSRLPVKGEPWFPTRVGDFVLLDDGNRGQVEAQTPEIVILKMGNSRKHYATAAFLAKNPQVFVKGFDAT